MPIYEYRCGRCGRTTAALVPSASHPGPGECDHCGARALERTLSAFAYHMSEGQKLASLDPKYGERVDAALARAPKDTDPGYHLKKMVPFSAAPSGGAGGKE